MNFDNVLITGSAGFIGFHVAQALLKKGLSVIGVDGLTRYYDIELKKKRNALLVEQKKYRFINCMLEDEKAIFDIFKKFRPRIVIHLAAQAGVRVSVEKQNAFFQSNLVGTYNILEAVRQFSCDHFLMASSSSVYGSNTKMPWKEIYNTDKPISFYAATKKSTEVMSHYYSHLYDIPTTCLRFFTVYGPWGRPDMALFKFSALILGNKSIEIYGKGDMMRDFTYIDDVVSSVIRLIEVLPKKNKHEDALVNNDSLSEVAPWRVINIGNSKPTKLLDFIATIERVIGKDAIKIFSESQPGDVKNTGADVSLLKSLTGFQPSTSLQEGVEKFLFWYKNVYLEVNKSL